MLFSSLKKETEDLVMYNKMKINICLLVIMVCISHISFSQIRYNLNNENQIAISYTNPKTYEVAEIKVEGEKIFR